MHNMMGGTLLFEPRRPSVNSSRPSSPPAPSAPRRNLTVPTPIRPSRLNPSPPPHSPSPLPNTAPAPVPDFTALSRQSSTRSALRSNPTDEDVHSTHDDAHPLQAEIDRLSGLCNQHELKFRSSKASFEHRVFSEFPSALGRLSDLDTRAEKATADLYGTMHQTVPKLEARLQALLDERAEDVETMRERTTPWTAFVAEDASDPNKLRRVRSGGRGRIGKIERVRSNTEGAAHDNGEALAMFERWADEVETHLTGEIGCLETQIKDENRKRSVISSACVVAALLLFVALLVHGVRLGIAGLLRRFWWRGGRNIMV